MVVCFDYNLMMKDICFETLSCRSKSLRERLLSLQSWKEPGGMDSVEKNLYRFRKEDVLFCLDKIQNDMFDLNPRSMEEVKGITEAVDEMMRDGLPVESILWIICPEKDCHLMMMVKALTSIQWEMEEECEAEVMELLKEGESLILETIRFKIGQLYVGIGL